VKCVLPAGCANAVGDGKSAQIERIANSLATLYQVGFPIRQATKPATRVAGTTATFAARE
jgi:hypothetical protein